MYERAAILTSNSKTLAIGHHLCSSTLCTATQLLSSAAGSCSDTHSNSSNFKCKLFLFAYFFFFPPHTSPSPLPPPSSLLHRGLQPWLQSDQPVTLIYKRETGRQRVTADNHHGISKFAVFCFYSGFVWRFWGHHGHPAT